MPDPFALTSSQTFRSTTRPLAVAEQGMVTTPHYLASMAGVRVLLDGGNAVDAAIAASAVLCVTYPHMAGIGGDLLALVWHAGSRSLHALNASGRAPARASWEVYRERGLPAMPVTGGLSVTVPGAVDGWGRLHRRFGSRPLADLLAPAIAYAEAAPLTWTVADRLTRYRSRILLPVPETDLHAPGAERRGDRFPLSLSPAGRAGRGGRSVGGAAGRGFREGERWPQPALASTLRAVASGGPEAFYRGEIAERLAAAVQRAGGFLTVEDLAAHTGDWVEPIEGRYRDARVFEMPPSTQGVTALQILGLLDGLAGLEGGPLSADRMHRMVEATKLAFADRNAFVGDPSFVDVPVQRLLDPETLAARRALIDPHVAAIAPQPTIPPRGDTVYLATADRDGNLVSLIESLYSPFGSGVLDAATGVLLHNRGAGFSLDPESPNRLEPGKRPLHTLIPALVFRGDEPWLAFGAMGGDGQPQTQVQVLSHLVDQGLNVQEAIEAPRWLSGRWEGDEPPNALHLEARFPPEVAADLAARGHTIIMADAWDRRVGHAQAVLVDREHGYFHGGADPRGDGLALGW